SAALKLGIAFIHQELPFAGHLTVAQNLFLGREPQKGLLRFIDDRRLNEDARRILEPYPIDVDPRVRISRLSIAQQQIVAIAGALSSGANLVVLDEATTALTEREADRLFALLESLAARGMTFIMITHRLEEVFRIASRVTVMRDGRTIAALDTADVTPRDLVRHMVGREVADIYPARPKNPTAAAQRARLSVRDLRTWKLRGVTFDVYPGEVLGVAGLMGAGRTSLFNALFGVDRLMGGTLAVDGVPVQVRNPAEAIAHRMAYVTEDRKANGLALLRGVKENITLARLGQHVRWGILKDRELEEVAGRFVRKLAIELRPESRTGILSGGNQQKVVLAKWLATGADVYLFDEPTRGIDVGSKLDVYDLINELTAAGKSVVLATSELPELLAMSDRLLVLSEGSLVRTLTREEATPEQVVYYASMKPNQAVA
ncbi:MAG TPA: sugar ABC transporter ATP-binding protein, partial [Rhodothermales bacterium]